MRCKNTIIVDGVTYDLNYDVDVTGDNVISLSVSKMRGGEIVDISRVKFTPISFDDMVEFMDVMCSNTVTPTGFRDAVSDMICERIFVE